jgi:hypothetical protein
MGHPVEVADPDPTAALATAQNCDGVVAFSQTDFTEDLKKITVPALRS